MSRKFRHPCGCVSTDSAWVSFCAACQLEHDERKRQAQADYRRLEDERAARNAPRQEARP